MSKCKLLILVALFGVAPLLGISAEKSPLTTYVEALFVEINQIQEPSTLQLRPFTFINAEGQTFYVYRSQLTSALLKALDVVDLKATAPLVEKQALRKRIAKWVGSLKPKTIRLTGAMAEMSADVGVIPALVILAAYPPWTLVTEAVESMVMGPAHVFCQASQALYFYLVQYFLRKVRSTRRFFQLLNLSDKHNGVVTRIKAAFRIASAEKRFVKLTRQIFLEQIPTLLRQKDFLRHMLQQPEGFLKTMGESPLWGDLYQKKLMVLDLNESSLHGANIQGKAGRHLLILDHMTSLELIRKFISHESLEAVIDKSISYGTYLKLKHLLGKIARQSHTFQTMLMYYVETNQARGNPRRNPMTLPRFQKIYYSLLRSISETSQALKDPGAYVRAHTALTTTADFLHQEHPPALKVKPLKEALTQLWKKTRPFPEEAAAVTEGYRVIETLSRRLISRFPSSNTSPMHIRHFFMEELRDHPFDRIHFESALQDFLRDSSIHWNHQKIRPLVRAFLKSCLRHVKLGK